MFAPREPRMLSLTPSIDRSLAAILKVHSSSYSLLSARQARPPKVKLPPRCQALIVGCTSVSRFGFNASSCELRRVHCNLGDKWLQCLCLCGSDRRHENPGIRWQNFDASRVPKRRTLSKPRPEASSPGVFRPLRTPVVATWM